MGKRHRHSTLERSRQIADVLARHGLGYLVGVFGLERVIPFQRGLLKHPRRATPYTQPEHLRMACEELGTTFIKFGQILSTRSDLLSVEYEAEFVKLQDAAPAIAFDEVQETLVAELGKPIQEIFATFDASPLAIASIGQAHVATLVDGTAVVVKVRRPGVVELVEEDLAILQNLAVTASHRWKFASQYDLVGLVQEFAQTLRAELDYLQEGRNAERIAANFAGDTTIHIPRIFWETTTSCVLTLEHIEGIKMNDLVALDAAHLDRTTIAEHAAHLVLKMVFEHGFFHADPHPGNFFIETDGRIGLIDFGLVGTIDEATRERLVKALIAVASQDPDRLVDAFLELGVSQQVDRPLFSRDLQLLLSHYSDQPLSELKLGPLLQEMLTIVRRHHLHLPSNLALLLKTVMMHEGLGVQLDPTFRLTSVLIPYAQQLMLRQYSPLSWAKRIGQSGLDAALFGTELPRQLRRLLGDLERGDLRIGMRLHENDPVIRRVEQWVNRLVFAMIASAFIIGLAMLLASYRLSSVNQGTIFLIGFIIVVALGVALAWSILRSRHH